ncbi:snf2 family amino-terminal protein [Phaffia rhodozyma]|uniref:Snf2 family amino-terminal protein n=1 Tax=Phaffia rhodozyma TaxID=264483 RepID=A0A0F7SK95_PHARH|nr:snf2 family amino-terminal protein [Phaffia rhodozyma]
MYLPSQEEIERVVKASLGRENDPISSFPPEIVSTIGSFLEKFPYDDNFVIERQEGRGYGVLTCMEDRCWCDVEAVRNSALPDGGVSIGLGSMDSFIEHIQNHPTHSTDRDQRQKDKISQYQPNYSQSSSMFATRPNLKRHVSSEAGPSTTLNRLESDQSFFTPNKKRIKLEDSRIDSATPILVDSSSPILVDSSSPILIDSSTESSPRSSSPILIFSPVDQKPQFEHVQQERRRLLGAELDYLKEIIAQTSMSARSAIMGRINHLLDSMRNNPVTTPPERTNALNTNLPEVRRLFGSITEPPPGFDTQFSLRPSATYSQPHASGSSSYYDRFGIGRYDDSSDEERTQRDSQENRLARDVNMREFFSDALSEFSSSMTVKDSLHKLGLENMTDKMPGMKVFHIQQVSHEAKPSYAGGILAVFTLAMGLGKTIQTVALMTKNISDNPRKKGNLIIAPLALLDQWKTEIETRTNASFSVLIYHGTAKKISKKEIRKYDVVLTTYGTIITEFPKPKKRRARVAFDGSDPGNVDDEEEQTEPAPKKYGPLARIEWFRIILDEAQMIRNKSTRASTLIAELEGDYRWCLTGTPITNGVDDLYGLFRFLRTPKYHEWSEFRDRIHSVAKRSPNLAAKRAQIILRATSLRRTKDSQIDGKALLTLPEKEIIIDELVFSPIEREIYTAVETQARVRFNKFLKAGTVMKNYSHVLTMLLRLRQLCNHPRLVVKAKGDPLGFDDLVLEDGDGSGIHTEAVDEDEYKRAVAVAGQEWVDEAVLKLKNRMLESQKKESEGDGELGNDYECPVCMDILTQPLITRCCLQLYCTGCIESLRVASPQYGENPDANCVERKCPTCRGVLDQNSLFRASVFEPPTDDSSDVSIPDIKDEEDDLDLQIGSGRRIKQDTEDDDASIDDKKSLFKPSIKGKERAQSIPLPPSIVDEDDENIEPSIKMEHMMNLIKQWQEADSDDKIIIFSQYVKYIELLQIILSRAGHKFLLYHGGMNIKDRDATVKQFQLDEDAKILIVSLKCGGVGLNLTRANRVINCDLAWNTATESQALDRVHRIGQSKDVSIRRLVVKDTVEQRILDLQARKQQMADGALGEGTGQKIGRMTVGDLADLFGVPVDR